MQKKTKQQQQQTLANEGEAEQRFWGIRLKQMKER